jgi:hypothetical protein
MAACKNINATATTDEQHESFRFDEVVLIANDDTTNDLLISLGLPFTDNNYYVLKPGETLEKLKLTYRNVYYKSLAGEVPFRFYSILC